MAVRQRLSWVVTTTGPAALTRWLIRACHAQEARSRPRPGPRPPAGTPVPEIISALLPSWRALPPAPARSAGPGRVPDRKVPACSATGPGTGASAENRASHPTPGYPYSLDRAGPRPSRPVSSRLIADATQGGRGRVPAHSLALLPQQDQALIRIRIPRAQRQRAATAAGGLGMQPQQQRVQIRVVARVGGALVDLRQPGIRHGPPGGRQAAGFATFRAGLSTSVISPSSWACRYRQRSAPTRSSAALG